MPAGPEGKKLTDVARAMFAARATSEEFDEATHPVARDMRALGASQSDITKAIQALRERQRKDETVIEVHPDNWETVKLFAALNTQWRRAGMGAVQTGLDYTAIRPTAEGLGIELDPQRFQEIRLMEAGAMMQMADNRKGEENGQ